MSKTTPDPTGGDNHPLVEATRKGYLGSVPDETPNAAYTVPGVTSGAETPETQEPGTAGSTKHALPDEPAKG